MITVTFNAQDCYLLDDAPDWAYRFAVEATIPGVYERGLTGRETRRATADTLRLGCTFTALLTSAAAVDRLRNALQGLNMQPVLCPFYPGLFDAGATPIVTASYYALFNADDTFNSIQPASEGPFEYRAAPLMVGRFSEDPDPEMISFCAARVEFRFTENGNFPLTFPVFEAVDGLDTAGGVRPLFPFQPDWSKRPNSGASEQDVDRRQIGNLRTLATAYYAQRGRRICKQYFTLQQNDAFFLFAFFQAMGGEQNNFWLPAAMSEAKLAANVESADVTLTVDNGAALGSNSFILLTDGFDQVPVVVDSVVENTWNLHRAPGMAFKAGLTAIESLVLARFDALKLELEFANPATATATLQFKELPWETNAVAGETYGVTMGALPPTASFFKFSTTTPTETEYWRFTNFERDLTDADGNTWLSAPMEFDTINETSDLKRNSTEIKSRNFPGNPLALLFPNTIEWPLDLEIYEADVNPATSMAGNFLKLFYGELDSAEYEPPFIAAKVSTLSYIFARKIPRRLYQKTDNWCLFEEPNGLRPADWKWNAKVASYDPDTGILVVGTITSTNTAVIEENYFTYGYLIVTTAGKHQVRMISSNSVIAAGVMTVHLSNFLETAPAVDDVLALYPGYDGQAYTAGLKFHNYQTNFGGFPFMPTDNPTILKISTSSSTKK